jgi:hypothetical protein
MGSGDFLHTLPSPLSQQARQFFAIWQGWRGARRLPQRSDLSMGDLGAMADGCLLLNIRSADEIRMEDVGRTMIEKIGFDVTGMNYLDLTSRENRSWRATLTIALAAQPCGALIYYWLRYPDGAVLPVEYTAAPLYEDGAAQANLILCCATGLADTAGRKQTLDPDSYMEGDGMRFIDLGYGVPPLVPAERQEVRSVQ